MSYLYTFEADHMVANLDEAIEIFGRNFGLWPRADWPLLDFPPEGTRGAFCPVGDWAVAPTYFSLIEPTDFDHWMGRAWQEQAPRPHRYHCFCPVADDLDFPDELSGMNREPKTRPLAFDLLAHHLAVTRKEQSQRQAGCGEAPPGREGLV